MNIKNNQRFKDSEVRMQAAMLELMRETNVEKITVKQVCERAEVNRSTFYAHFRDIFDMLEKMELSLSGELLQQYESENITEEMVLTEESFYPFFGTLGNTSIFTEFP